MTKICSQSSLGIQRDEFYFEFAQGVILIFAISITFEKLMHCKGLYPTIDLLCLG